MCLLWRASGSAGQVEICLVEDDDGMRSVAEIEVEISFCRSFLDMRKSG